MPVPHVPARRPDVQVSKFVVAGGFGVGKTTLIGAVSEIEPLRTEEVLTQAGARTDSLDGVAGKTTTTVTMDFGRITFPGTRPSEVLLFGTPGQARFMPFWDHLVAGAHGAVVLVDTRRLEDSFHAVGYFEHSGIPFVVAANVFDGAARYPEDDVARALRLPPGIPVISCDARSEDSAAGVLIDLVRHADSLALTASAV
ncbi:MULTISPECIES: ATP/GTP-binding protein [unclassified Streptomyces]|uniref:GTP-binding protein n=1 Tax=unclassified Streptomyces TaxID=2593676 RepID=UPI00364440DC